MDDVFSGGFRGGVFDGAVVGRDEMPEEVEVLVDFGEDGAFHFREDVVIEVDILLNVGVLFYGSREDGSVEGFF